MSLELQFWWEKHRCHLHRLGPISREYHSKCVLCLILSFLPNVPSSPHYLSCSVFLVQLSPEVRAGIRKMTQKAFVFSNGSIPLTSFPTWKDFLHPESSCRLGAHSFQDLYQLKTSKAFSVTGDVLTGKVFGARHSGSACNPSTLGG